MIIIDYVYPRGFETRSIYRPDALPDAKPTLLKHWRLVSSWMLFMCRCSNSVYGDHVAEGVCSIVWTVDAVICVRHSISNPAVSRIQRWHAHQYPCLCHCLHLHNQDTNLQAPVFPRQILPNSAALFVKFHKILRHYYPQIPYIPQPVGVVILTDNTSKYIRNLL